MEVLFKGKKKQVRFSGTLSDLLKKLGIARETVVLKRNGKVAPENAKVGGTDKVEVIQVVFGG